MLENLSTAYENLGAHQRIAVRRIAEWYSKARDNQLVPDTNHFIYLYLAGRGFGKTRLASERCFERCTKESGIRYGVLAPTYNDLRKVCFEGDSGLTSVIPRELIANFDRQSLELRLTNGSLIQGISAEKPDRVRGFQFHEAWCDELSSWSRLKETWDNLMMALRLGTDPKAIITTTPKPLQFIKDMVRRKDVYKVSGSTYENIDNLAPSFKQMLLDTYEGTRLGRQELYAEVLEDIEGALWNEGIIKIAENAPEFERIIVAIDPAVSTNKGSDETGIVVCGVGRDGLYYVLDDLSGHHTPESWARTAIDAYKDYEADRIIGEVNNGGDMIERIIRSIDDNVSYKAVRASRGKVTRAEPIAALYEQGKVLHIKRLPTLEQQMCEFTVDFDRNKMGYSPDRIDALVWGITELMNNNGAMPRFTVIR